MAFRGKEMMKKILKTVGENGLSRREKETLEKCMPRSKVVMNRAKRGLFAGRHIQFGNSVSEDGGNKFVSTSPSSFDFFFLILVLVSSGTGHDGKFHVVASGVRSLFTVSAV